MFFTTHPHVSKPLRPSEHSLTYFRFRPKDFCPSLKWYTILVQKGNKDIIKVVHVTSVG